MNSTPTLSPNATLTKQTARGMSRTESCNIASLCHAPDIDSDRLKARRPSRSLGSLAELNVDGQSSPAKKAKKSSLGRLRKLKALSTFEFKSWRSSYIDLSSIGNS